MASAASAKAAPTLIPTFHPIDIPDCGELNGGIAGLGAVEAVDEEMKADSPTVVKGMKSM